MLFVQSFRLLKRCYWRAGDEGVKGWRLYCVWKELIPVSDCARKERAVSAVPSARKTLLLQTVLFSSNIWKGQRTQCCYIVTVWFVCIVWVTYSMFFIVPIWFAYLLSVIV